MIVEILRRRGSTWLDSLAGYGAGWTRGSAVDVPDEPGAYLLARSSRSDARAHVPGTGAFSSPRAARIGALTDRREEAEGGNEMTKPSTQPAPSPLTLAAAARAQAAKASA